MDQRQYSHPNKDSGHDFDFSAPPISLLNGKQWLYIQRHFHLTDRELQIAKLVCSGFNNEEIAAKLKIKRGTVKTHIRNIYRRVRIKNKIQMVLKFLNTATKFTNKSDTTAISAIEIEKFDKKMPAIPLRIYPNK
jgi:DNA-binding CsgD family transcriptional regulator